MTTPEQPKKRRGGAVLIVLGIILCAVGLFGSGGIQDSAGDDIAMAVSLILTLVFLMAGIVCIMLGVRRATRR